MATSADATSGANDTSASELTTALKKPLQVGSHSLKSRLILGTGRYDTFEIMRDSLAASGTHCITVAVRRERLYNTTGQNILDFIDTDRYLLLPNTRCSDE